MSILKLSFHGGILVEAEFYPKAMFEAIHKFSVVDFGVIEIEKSFVDNVFIDGVAEVNAVFVFFDGGRFYQDITRKT